MLIYELIKEIAEAQLYPDAESYAKMDKPKINYPIQTYEEMKENTSFGMFIRNILFNYQSMCKIVGLTDININEYLAGIKRLKNDIVLDAIQIGIDYYIKFKKELAETKTPLEYQTILHKYRKVFDRYGTPQVGAMNFNSSSKKSVYSLTDWFTTPFGLTMMYLFDTYIEIFNNKYGLDNYLYREPFELSILSKKGFKSYQDFWYYANSIKELTA